MSNQPPARIKGFNFEQSITRGGEIPTVEFSRFLQQILQILNFGGRLANTTTPTVSASPYTYANNTGNEQSVVVAGGTVSKIEFIRNGVATDVGVVAGMFQLSPLDSLRVTYTVAPTVTVVVR